MSGLKVIKPGVLATIVDWGRYGHRENGLTTGGPMDEHAFLWSNRILENSPGACVIEINVGLSVFESMINSSIAVCGADMGLTINNTPVTNWSTHAIKIGDRLIFRSAKKGLRAYLGIQGGFDVEEVFSSATTVVREHLGGLDGGALKKDDIINAAGSKQLNFQRKVPTEFTAEYSNQTTLGFIPSYQYDLFEPSQQKAFVSQTYTISQRMDRMGCRLEGEKIDYRGAGIISEGIAIGSIQIPPDGQPIILLKDSGTIGGYPKLGCISRLDINKLAQCRPGNTVKFKAVNPQSACEGLVKFYRFFEVNSITNVNVSE